MKPEKPIAAIDTLIRGMDDAERDQLFTHLNTTYRSEIGRTALRQADVPASEQFRLPVLAPEPLLLTPEQQEKANKVTLAMAERFGVPAENFSVVRTAEEDGKEGLTVLYAASNGLDLGDPNEEFDSRRSWNAIFDEENTDRFMITVNGEKIDTRAGMTAAAYKAFGEGAIAQEIQPLPDSYEAAEKRKKKLFTKRTETFTLLTGEKQARGKAPTAYIDTTFYTLPTQIITEDGRRARVSSEEGSRSLRFRPAVAIE